MLGLKDICQQYVMFQTQNRLNAKDLLKQAYAKEWGELKDTFLRR